MNVDRCFFFAHCLHMQRERVCTTEFRTYTNELIICCVTVNLSNELYFFFVCFFFGGNIRPFITALMPLLAADFVVVFT